MCTDLLLFESSCVRQAFNTGKRDAEIGAPFLTKEFCHVIQRPLIHAAEHLPSLDPEGSERESKVRSKKRKQIVTERNFLFQIGMTGSGNNLFANK